MLGLLLPALLLGCFPKTPAHRKVIGPGVENGTGAPGPARDAEGSESDRNQKNTVTGGLPFPEVQDTLGWDAPYVNPDSAHPNPSPDIPGDRPSGWSSPPVAARPAPTRRMGEALPPVSRPPGIRQRPRPKDLPEKARVLLYQGPKPLSLYSLGEIQVLAEVAANPSPAPTGRAGASGPTGTSSPTAATASGKNTGTLAKLAVLKGRFVIRRSGTGFEVIPTGKSPITSGSRRMRLMSVNPYNLLDLNGTVYRGGLHVLAEGRTEIEAINVLGVEDYLRGVLPYELGTVDREALEALKALAVVARTYAYKRMTRATGNFHLHADVQDQVYRGVKGEYLLSDRAVWETRSMAVTQADTLTQCFYFSTCGGRTSSKHEVWGGDSIPYLTSRPDTDAVGEPYCKGSKYSSWKQEWSLAKLAPALRRDLRSAGVTDYPAFTTVKNVEVVTRGACERIRVLKFETDKGPVLVKGDKVRFALRPEGAPDRILESAWFDVKISGGTLIAQGHGFGHGVGLCQMGAIARARSNQNFKQIIEAYYQGIQVTELR